MTALRFRFWQVAAYLLINYPGPAAARDRAFVAQTFSYDWRATHLQEDRTRACQKTPSAVGVIRRVLASGGQVPGWGTYREQAHSDLSTPETGSRLTSFHRIYARQNKHTKACASISVMPLHTLTSAPRGDTCAASSSHLMAFPKECERSYRCGADGSALGGYLADLAPP